MKHYRSLVIALLGLHALMVVLIAQTTPITADEHPYIAAGYVIRTEWEFDALVTIFHGPLPYYANQLLAFFGVNVVPVEDYLFAARLGMLGFTLLGGFVVAQFARRSFGPQAGVFALALYVASPLVIGHASLVTVDVTLAAFYMLTLYVAWSYINAPSLPRAAFTGVALGASLATKYLALFLVPVLVIASAGILYDAFL